MAKNASPPQSPFPSDSVDWDAIARYLAGESSHDDAAAIRRWLDAHPSDARVIEALGESISALSPDSPSDLDVDAALSRVKARFDEPEVRPIRGMSWQPRIASTSRRWKFVGSALAAAAVLAVAGSLTKLRSPHPEASTVVASSPYTYVTPVGARDSISLPDGSRIVLGPDSRLTVPADYGRRDRRVELSGVAFFEVQHDAARPFAVRARHAIIEDIGTTFAIGEASDGSVMVSVTTGTVKLRPTADAATGITLDAGDRGVMNPDGVTHAYPGRVSVDDVAWTHGRLVFRDAPISHVIADMRRWFGIDLRLADSSLAARHITASFANDSPDDVLRVIALTLGARIERRGDTAIVHDLRLNTVRR